MPARKLTWLPAAFLALAPLASWAYQQTSNETPAPVLLTTQEDHARTMALLGIKELRRGANGSNPQADNYANYDESKANPYPNLPDPLMLNNGGKVTTAAQWWNQRRPELVEIFDREIYGRLPQNMPKVTWMVSGAEIAMNGDVPIVTKTLIGHVDNSFYPQITVDLRLTLSTPANSKGPVPVILELGGGAPAGQNAKAAPKQAAPKQAKGPTGPT